MFVKGSHYASGRYCGVTAEVPKLHSDEAKHSP